MTRGAAVAVVLGLGAVGTVLALTLTARARERAARAPQFTKRDDPTQPGIYMGLPGPWVLPKPPPGWT